MASVASQFIEKVTVFMQSDSLEDAQAICADGTYFPNNLRMCVCVYIYIYIYYKTREEICIYITDCNLHFFTDLCSMIRVGLASLTFLQQLDIGVGKVFKIVNNSDNVFIPLK